MTMRRSARLTETLAAWGCWDDSWSVPTSGGITQARQRLGYEPLKELFGEVAVPVAEEETAGAFLGDWRLMAIDGLAWDAPDTRENVAAFGFPGAGEGDRAAFPKVRVVTISECASHAVVGAATGVVAGKGAGEQSLARKLYRRLEEDWLLIADRNFFSWADWCTAAGSGAALLWRVKADLTLPVLDLLPDGSYSSVLVNPKIRGKARRALMEAARAGQDLDEERPATSGWSSMRSPTGSNSSEPSASSAAGPPTRRPFPPDHQQRTLAAVMAAITRKKNLNPGRRHRTFPRAVKRARHNSYRVKRPGDHGTRHPGPATIRLVNHRQLTIAA
jgi:hypothetical protein